MKKIFALITGGAGQDGSYLADFLIKKNYKVVVADRRSSRADNWRHKFLKIEDKLIYEDFDLLDFDSIFRLLKKYNFKEVYNLAAQSFVKSSFLTPISTCEITGLGALKILEAIRIIGKKIKFYQASSSEMIGNSLLKSQNENTIFNPQSPYAISKIFAHNITKNYRESYGIFACSGICFNHESPLRGEDFVTRKISKGLAEIKLGLRKNLELGNLDIIRDWGHAKDYVRAMWLMMQIKKADDFVIATNKSHSIKDFINQSCNYLRLKIRWIGEKKSQRVINLENNKTIIKINSKFYRPLEVNYLKGNYNKARKILKWEPSITFKDLVKEMVEEDLKRLKK